MSTGKMRFFHFFSHPNSALDIPLIWFNLLTVKWRGRMDLNHHLPPRKSCERCWNGSRMIRHAAAT